MVTSRRRWLAVSVLALVCAATLITAWYTLCPVCHLGIVRSPQAVASVGDVEPSKNLAIWNGSYHGPDYEDHIKICTRCWMAYHRKLHWWERDIEAPDAFRRPLSSAIRHVPLPPAEHIRDRVVYEQCFRDHQFRESVGFWCDDIPEIIQPLRDYAAAHGLFCREDGPEYGRRSVVVETNPPTI
jgi:hypothetical protein